jgi:hypothetical protein
MRDIDVATTFANCRNPDSSWRLPVLHPSQRVFWYPGRFCFASYPQRQTTASRRMTYCGTNLNFANIVPCSAASSLRLWSRS